jgi:hypothetical protein
MTAVAIARRMYNIPFGMLQLRLYSVALPIRLYLRSLHGAMASLTLSVKKQGINRHGTGLGLMESQVF